MFHFPSTCQEAPVALWVTVGGGGSPAESTPHRGGRRPTAKPQLGEPVPTSGRLLACEQVTGRGGAIEDPKLPSRWVPPAQCPLCEAAEWKQSGSHSSETRGGPSAHRRCPPRRWTSAGRPARTHAVLACAPLSSDASWGPGCHHVPLLPGKTEAGCSSELQSEAWSLPPNPPPQGCTLGGEAWKPPGSQRGCHASRPRRGGPAPRVPSAPQLTLLRAVPGPLWEVGKTASGVWNGAQQGYPTPASPGGGPWALWVPATERSARLLSGQPLPSPAPCYPGSRSRQESSKSCCLSLRWPCLSLCRQLAIHVLPSLPPAQAVKPWILPRPSIGQALSQQTYRAGDRGP
ncbi:uncharacterized protein LOC120581182 [Pteropus medius]|uniref:uncharacterized protein LOC120581182 n=1 Tax=Pteropus vampyrus TaxID=132908 RepID=UPI00196A7CFB|nr:uncharacterized protein LOC120581182 [Pteropus giganteus]